MIQRSILVAEDLENFTELGQRRGKAVRGVAQAVSKLLQEKLRLLYVEDLKTYPFKKIYNEQDLPSWHEGHHRILKQLSKDFSNKVQCLIRSGSPAEEILSEIHKWPRPEMVILGTQGHQGLEKILEGSVAEKVLLKSERPVMVLGPHCQDRIEKSILLKGHKPLRILVPTDLTRASRPAEQYAMSLAARIDAELVFFHSVFDQIRRVQEASIMSGFVAFDLERISKKMTRDAIMALENKKHRIKKTISHCEYKIAETGQRVTESLLQESAINYYLVVMGTHSRRNALLRSLIGSTAQEMILRSEVPIVAVHAH